MRVFSRLLAVCLLIWPSLLVGQTGTLQIHFMDVGQGDGAILISPGGETVLFDNGVRNNCDKPFSYLQQLGITQIDYHVASHYHDDHIGCTVQVLDQFPLNRFAFDRGGSYHTGTFNSYVTKVGSKRQTVVAGQRVTLDAGATTPVFIDFVALNGAGVMTTNENDLSVVAVVHYGNFDAEIAGDLSGFDENSYEDIETPVAPMVGQVEVYKVHHHGNRYSSNETWLAAIQPRVGIISAGDGNGHGHPTEESLERLHTAGVQLFWTARGNGAGPEPGFDTIAGDIIVEVVPGGSTFTVRHTEGSRAIQSFAMWGAGPGPMPEPPAFAWSRRSNVFHHAACAYVRNISPENLVTSATAPTDGKTLHQGCPR